MNDNALPIALAIVVGFYVVTFFYCWSLYTALKIVPSDKQLFPAWLIWLIMIPLAGYIISWMMVPFGIPRSFESYLSANPQAIKDSRTLFGMGIAQMILMTVSFLPVLGLLGIAAGVASLIIAIIYWVRVVSFKKAYLV